MNGTDSRTEQQWQCVASRANHGHWSDHQEDGQFGNESISLSVNSFTFYFERTDQGILTEIGEQECSRSISIEMRTAMKVRGERAQSVHCEVIKK